MNRLPYVNSLRDLIAYQKALTLAREIFEVSKPFPQEEMYSLTDQIRRASRSIGGQIVEGWEKRHYEQYFVSKLTDADGEPLETQHWIETALDCEYISTQKGDHFIQKCEEIGRLLGGTIAKSDQFCATPATQLHEPALEYFIHSTE